MYKVIQSGNLKKQLESKCPNCECEFEYSLEDVQERVSYSGFIWNQYNTTNTGMLFENTLDNNFVKPTTTNIDTGINSVIPVCPVVYYHSKIVEKYIICPECKEIIVLSRTIITEPTYPQQGPLYLNEWHLGPAMCLDKKGD